MTPRTSLVVFALVVIGGLSGPSLAAAEAVYSNPVIGEGNLADPAILFYEGKYYLYPTGDTVSYHVYTSTDLVHWTKGARVFAPGGGNVWAPDVVRNPQDGKFYLYYTAHFRVGVAVADVPDASFEDRGILVEGAIDAHLFIDDDGQYYLYYVTLPGFGNWVQRMKTPLEKAGDPVRILEPSEEWEQRGFPVNEGPWMIKHRGVYYLLYSGSPADTADYAIGYATARSPLGPFAKYSGNPIVKRSEGVYGPGHCAVIRDGQNRLWLVYHQKKNDLQNYNRMICIDPLEFDDRGVLHGKATRGTLEPAPVSKAITKRDIRAPARHSLSTWP